MKRKSKIYLFKGTPKEVKKVYALSNRIVGISYVSPYPLDDKLYFAFELSEKLNRKIKISKLNNKVRSKKMISLVKTLSSCRIFDSNEIFVKFKMMNQKPMKVYRWDNPYKDMPKYNKKDNQKIHDKKLPELDKMSKSELIKIGNKIRGIKIRRPRKTASRKTWKNFIERFYNVEWYQKNH